MDRRRYIELCFKLIQAQFSSGLNSNYLLVDKRFLSTFSRHLIVSNSFLEGRKATLLGLHTDSSTKQLHMAVCRYLENAD